MNVDFCFLLLSNICCCVGFLHKLNPTLRSHPLTYQAPLTAGMMLCYRCTRGGTTWTPNTPRQSQVDGELHPQGRESPALSAIDLSDLAPFCEINLARQHWASLFQRFAEPLPDTTRTKTMIARKTCRLLARRLRVLIQA